MLTKRLAALLVGATSWLLAYYVFGAKRLKRIQGPKHLPFFGAAFEMHKVNQEDKLLEWFLDNCAKFGWKTWGYSYPGQQAIVLTTPENVKYMLKDNFKNYVKGDRYGALTGEVLGHGIFSTDGHMWQEQRKLASHLFTVNQLKSRMEEVFIDHATDMLEILKSTAPNTVIDLQDIFFKYTFDCINEIAFGRSVNSLGGNVEDLKFAAAFDDAQVVMVKRFFNPGWMVMKALGLSYEKQMPSNIQVMNEYLDRVVDDRMAEHGEAKDRNDLITLFFNFADKGGKSFDKKYVRDLIMNFIFAGRDTTAAALTWTFYLLSLHPEVEARLIEEVSKISEVNYLTLKDLPYAKAIFYETLRLYPSVPLDGKFAFNEDTLPDGTHVPPGCLVLYHPAVLGHNPNNWDNPEKFDPDRWMGNEIHSEFKYPTFNAGFRICLGKMMAGFEATLVMTSIIKEGYRVRVRPGYVPVWKQGATLQAKEGLPCTLIKTDPTS